MFKSLAISIKIAPLSSSSSSYKAANPAAVLRPLPTNHWHKGVPRPKRAPNICPNGERLRPRKSAYVNSCKTRNQMIIVYRFT